LVELKGARTIFERIFAADRFGGKLSGLTDRDKTCSKKVGDDTAQNKATGFDPCDELGWVL
jgi:hypothetical protein